MIRAQKKAIAVAFSGGIDSACAAAILKREGWEVVGVHLVLPIPLQQREEKWRRARLISRQLNISMYSLDVRDIFQRNVIDYFIHAYRMGLTPNPCVVCNSMVKFEHVFSWMNKKGIDYMATGHYARVRKNAHGRDSELLRGKDRHKDQSYFLHRISRSYLSKTLFPLGDMTKAQVYQRAGEMGLSTLMHPESQEICFISDNNYKSFIESRVDNSMQSHGDIVDGEGKVLGVHAGTYAYTIGQRKGLGIGAKGPLYVCRIRPERNEIEVGPREALSETTLKAMAFTWMVDMKDRKTRRVHAQIRYRHKPAYGTLTVISPDSVRFEFDTPQWAITPGQAFVCYEGDRVLGGGWIQRP